MESDELSQQFAQSLTARGKDMRARIWLRKLKADFWTQHLSGRTLRLSQSNRFTDWWTCSLRGIHAKDSAPPASAKVKKILASYGLGFCGQLQLFNLACVSSRTSKDTSALDSDKSLEIWKRQVTEQRGEYSRRLKLERRTDGSGCLYWPSLRASDPEKRGDFDCENPRNRLPGMANTWPTPRCDVSPGSTHEDNSKSGRSLSKDAKEWPTPNVPNGGRKLDQETVSAKGQRQDGTKAQVGLENAAKVLTGGANSQRKNRPKTGGHDLQEQVTDWPTPQARDSKSGEVSQETMERNGRPLNEFVCRNFHPDQTNTTDGAKSQNGCGQRRRLNADFVDWLMGMPFPGWTDCGSQVMESCQQPQRELFERCSKG